LQHNRGKHYRSFQHHHRISSKFEAGKDRLFFIACATARFDGNGNVSGQPHGEQLVQYPPPLQPSTTVRTTQSPGDVEKCSQMLTW